MLRSTSMWIWTVALAAAAQAQTSGPLSATPPSPQRLFGPGPRPARPPEALRPNSGAARGDQAAPQLVDPDAPVPAPAVEELDDSIPLPIPAVYAPGEKGDVLVAPPSGDPFFLGFAAGNYFPPEGERIDPQLVAQVQASYADGRPDARTYAFAMFERRINAERIAELEALGARVLEFHPHYALKLALPVSAIDAVAAHPAVRWLGVPRGWQKLHPALVEQAQLAPANRPLEIVINVYESDLGPDSKPVLGNAPALVAPGGAATNGEAQPLAGVWISNGWMQRALEAAGVEVREFSSNVNSFRASVPPAALEALSALDFVQFVEWDAPEHTFHDESMPMVNADDVRNFYDGGSSSRAVVGIVDSGVENSHTSLDHLWGIAWNEAGVSGGAAAGWNDVCGHGSHVCGTMVGDSSDNSHDGVAPGAGWGPTGRLFNVRVFATCAAQSISVPNVLSHTGNDYNDGTNTTPKPHVTNNSWGADGSGNSTTAWRGTESDAREYDQNAWGGAQLNVFAAGNNGPTSYSIGLQASAKNVLTVGNVIDYEDSSVMPAGKLWDGFGGSSTGPVGDNRWKPNVVAPGRWITSVDAATASGERTIFGTSMAAPHVTGVITTLIDSNNSYAYLPELISAQLMATAFRDGDVPIAVPSDAQLDRYGAGRVDATRAVFSSSEESHVNWSFALDAGQSTYREFTVPANATRLVTVVHYVDTPASAGASVALVNNWDSVLDSPPLDTASNSTGDYFVQQSVADNTELRVVTSPAAGVWRVKVYPSSTTSTAYFGVSVFILTADPSPDVTLDVSADDIYVAPNQNVVISAVADTPSTSADAVFLDSTSSGDVLQAAQTLLKDGSISDLLGNEHDGRDVMLGNLHPFFDRTARWTTRWATEGVKNFAVEATGGNFTAVNDSVTIYVDATAPALPTGLVSTSHTVNVWSNDNTIDFDWNPSTDAVAGVDGYGVDWSILPNVTVGLTKDLEESVTQFTVNPGSFNTIYFAVKPVDNAGNWNAGKVEVGPYRIDTSAPTTPGVISSNVHTPGVQSCSTSGVLSWSASSDGLLSGLAGYIGVWDTNPTTIPTGAVNVSASATSTSYSIGSSTTPRYYHLRPRDNAGNFGLTRHFGPVLANAVSVSTYCTGKTNSLGCVPFIGSFNQPDKSAGSFTVTCNNVLNQKFGLLFFGTTQVATPFQGGTLCVGAPTQRTDSLSSGGATSGNSCSGSYSYQFTTARMNLFGMDPGETYFAQWWMRDPASASTTGLSNAVRFTVCE
jgi:hypothetical protein